MEITYKEANNKYRVAILRANEQYDKDVKMAEVKKENAYDIAAKERMKIKSKNCKLI